MNESTNNLTTTKPAAFTPVTSRITKTVGPTGDRKQVFLKDLIWFMPTLNCIHSILPEPDSWETKKSEEGTDLLTPVYENSIYNFVQMAVNRAVVQIAKTRAGQTPPQDVPEDWESLFASAGSSPFMAQKKIWLAGYQDYLASPELGYSDVKQRTRFKYTDVKQIMVLDDKRKAAIVEELNGYEASMSEDERVAVASVLHSFAKNLAVEPDVEEW